MEEIEEMAVELGCRVGSLPNVYLGFNQFSWNDIIYSYQNRNDLFDLFSFLQCLV